MIYSEEITCEDRIGHSHQPARPNFERKRRWRNDARRVVVTAIEMVINATDTTIYLSSEVFFTPENFAFVYAT